MLSFEVERERTNSSHICYYIFIMNIIVVPLPQCKDVVGTLHVSLPLLRNNLVFVFFCVLVSPMYNNVLEIWKVAWCCQLSCV